MGYDPPTTDPYEIIRRRREAEAKATREALAAGGTQPFQAVRKLTAQVAALQVQQEALEALVLRLPSVESRSDIQEGFTLDDVASSTWKTVASVTLPQIADKNRLTITASAQGMVMDWLTGGVTTAICRTRIAGTASPTIPAAKSIGAAVAENLLVVSQVRSLSTIPNPITVEFQMSAYNTAAFTDGIGNLANLTVYASYSKV